MGLKALCASSLDSPAHSVMVLRRESWGKFMDIQQDVTIKSWDGTWTYHPRVKVAPEGVEDLIEIVTDTVRFPTPVRPAGSMHSTARMNGDDQGGTMVDMKAMNRILHFTDDTVTVEAGVSHEQLAYALKDRGLQPFITTEIGNTTMAAMACAATKDSSFPGGFGQVSSYVTAVRLVTPQGQIREITEAENPKEMQLIRSSYGLFGIIFEVTIKVRPTTALAVRHYSLSLENFRKFFPIYKARGYAVMYYIFPYAKRVVVELRKDNPDVQPRSRLTWSYRNRFWRKYAPAVVLWIQKNIKSPKLRAQAQDLFSYALRQLLVLWVRSDRTWPHAQIINYPRDPGETKYLFSMWSFREGSFFDVLEEYCDFCIAYEAQTGFRCNLPSVGYAICRDVEALFSYTWEGPGMSIDPASTGGPEWEEFLHAYNEFCSDRRGVPLFNQTPFLTRDMVRRAFGTRLQQFAARRKEIDPQDRLLDNYFREFLS
jgi:L-gulonolactone oxidase